MLTPQQSNLFKELMEAFDGAKPPFALSDQWGECVGTFKNFFSDVGVRDVAEQYYNLRFADFSESDSRLLLYMHYMQPELVRDEGIPLKKSFARIYYERVRERDVHGLLKTVPLTGTADVDGVPLSIDQLMSIDDFYNLYELDAGVLDKPLFIADIGAGWGRLAHTLLHVNPLITYVDFDIPESLLIASSFLPSVLAVRVQVFPKNKPDILDKDFLQSASDVCLFPANDLERVVDGCFDIFLSTFSFQEMQRSSVSLYLKLMDLKTRRGGSVYTRQLYNKLDDRWDVIRSLGDYDFPRHWKQKFLRNVTFSDAFFEAGFNK